MRGVGAHGRAPLRYPAINVICLTNPDVDSGLRRNDGMGLVLVGKVGLWLRG